MNEILESAGKGFLTAVAIFGLLVIVVIIRQLI